MVKFLESSLAVASLSLISALRPVGNIFAACINLAIVLLRAYMTCLLLVLIDVVSHISGIGLDFPW